MAFCQEVKTTTYRFLFFRLTFPIRFKGCGLMNKKVL